MTTTKDDKLKEEIVNLFGISYGTTEKIIQKAREGYIDLKLHKAMQDENFEMRKQIAMIKNILKLEL